MRGSCHRCTRGIIRVARRSFSSNRIASADGGAVEAPITHFVFGANTDIGKTVLTAALIRASSEPAASNSSTTTTNNTHYIKPLQCGGSDESFIRIHAPDLSSATTLFQWDTPASPHLVARLEDKPVGDDEVLKALESRLSDLGVPDEAAGEDGPCGSGTSSKNSIWIETAGGVLSPSSSSPANRSPHHARDAPGGWGWVTQADLYQGFSDRSSVVMIGDGRLGGISSTLASLEAILRRNYRVGGILLIRDRNDNGGVDANLEALREYAAVSGTTTDGPLFADPDRSIVSLPALPPDPEPLAEWFASNEVRNPVSSFVHDHLFAAHGVEE
mmetsp:Transcript_9844/g.20619  ORF Transcript_9844/g.20619 Transcript_9844/m.20619 type:complete len:330 (+) Transcript_9844:165-1154(+)